ncbi:MAG: hypothetical protein ACFBSE_16195 [Prochloraceae cyanobacterium]
MSKYLELCQAYANALSRTRENRQKCVDFSNTFLKQMSNYFSYSFEIETTSFERDNTINIETSMILYEFPDRPDTGSKEKVILNFSIKKILDNYILTLDAWDEQYKLFENESDEFEEVYEFIYEKIREAYLTEIPLPEDEKSSVRDFVMPF